MDDIVAIEEKPELIHCPLSPEEFAEDMKKCTDSDPEYNHIRADELMCELLTSLGYKEGVDIFDKMSKWYS